MINPTYLRDVQRYLFSDEIVAFTARQRRVGPGGSILSPSVVVATNQRLLVIKDVLQLHIHENIDAVPYSNMTYVKSEHGLMSSTLTIGVLGFATPAGGEKNSFNVDGMRHADAVELADLIEKMMIRFRQQAAEQQKETETVGYMFNRAKALNLVCRSCHARNDAGAHFCWNCGAAL